MIFKQTKIYLIMNRVASLKTIVFCALLFSSLFVLSQAQEKMNVLFIAVDDLKPSIGSFGDEFAVTPNIDELSKSSTNSTLKKHIINNFILIIEISAKRF